MMEKKRFYFDGHIFSGSHRREKQLNGEDIAHYVKKRRYFDEHFSVSHRREKEMNGEVRKGILYVYNTKYEIKL